MGSAAVYVKVDDGTKKIAESILRDLGLTPTVIINMLYRQIILTHGVPFDIKLPIREPIAAGNLTDEEINSLILEADEEVKKGNVISLEEMEKIFKTKYGI